LKNNFKLTVADSNPSNMQVLVSLLIKINLSYGFSRQDYFMIPDVG